MKEMTSVLGSIRSVYFAIWLSLFFFDCLKKKALDSHWFGQSVDCFMTFRHISLIVSLTFLLHMLRVSSCFVLFCVLLIFSSQHVSGSAYKIVSQRAYHHGTMLISTRLDHLGDMLHPEEVLSVLNRWTDFRFPFLPALRVFDPLG